MAKRILWLAVSATTALSLLLAACGQAPIPTTPTAPTTPTTPTTPSTPTPPATPTTPTTLTTPAGPTPSGDAPKYGGTLNIYASDTTNWDPVRNIWGQAISKTYERAMEGAWEKGPAGGYGTRETEWGVANNDLFDLKQARIAETFKWTVDTAKNEGKVVLQIAGGIRYQSVNSEAGRLIAGREVTADDVAFAFKRSTTGDVNNFVFRNSPELRNVPVTKTGPREVTVTVPLEALGTAISRFSGAIYIYPPEIVTKYGDMQNWRNAVGTGPFILADFVPGSVTVLQKNPNYYLKDPVGPGKGNQLPYLDGVRIINIPDVSTRYAALRTGKLDQLDNISIEDGDQIKQTAPKLVSKQEYPREGRGMGATMVHDRQPFNDIRVRQALMVATDFRAINQGLFGGKGQIMSYPYSYSKEYVGLYIGFDDPDFPEEAKWLYEYDPNKAKQLLKEAGYPNGIKTSILLAAADVDYYSIIKDMWAKAGIDLFLDVRESTVLSNIQLNKTQTAMFHTATGPVSIYWQGVSFSGVAVTNTGMINDPVINNLLVDVRLARLTDEQHAIKIHRQLSKHIINQVYAIPTVRGNTYTLWWPWVKNYSGELWVGYSNYNTTTWTWLDQDLKKSMRF